MSYRLGRAFCRRGRTAQHGVKCDEYLDNITFILDLQASGKATSCHANLIYNFFTSCLEDKYIRYFSPS